MYKSKYICTIFLPRVNIHTWKVCFKLKESIGKYSYARKLNAHPAAKKFIDVVKHIEVD